MNKWVSRGLYTGASLLLAVRAFTYATGPDPQTTGAPNEKNCNQKECHNDNALNAAGGSLTLTVIPAEGGGAVSSYVPGKTYTVSVQVKKSGQSRWGFEMTSKKMDGSKGGTLDLLSFNDTQFMNAPSATQPDYIAHTDAGTYRNTPDVGHTWPVNWTAPAKGTGPITFYAAGNAANNDEDITGDFIYTQNLTLAEGGVTPAIIYGDLNGDKVVNVSDAALALQFAVKLKTPTADQLAAGDVAPKPGANGAPFGDGFLKVDDAVRILRRVAQMETLP